MTVALLTEQTEYYLFKWLPDCGKIIPFLACGEIAKSDYLLCHVCLSVRPSVRMEQLDTHWTDFHEILYLCIFRKSVERIQISLKADNSNG